MVQCMYWLLFKRQPCYPYAMDLTKPILAVDNLTLARGERVLFKALSFALQAGDCLLLTGENGSGKSSLLNALAGLIKPISGTISAYGDELSDLAHVYYEHVVYLSHKLGLKADLTVMQNMQWALLPKAPKESDILARAKQMHLLAHIDKPIKYLSRGQQQRAALMRVLLAEAPIWLLDEPLTGIDVIGQAVLTDVLAEHIEQGGVAVVATHQLLARDIQTQTIALEFACHT